MSSSTVEAECAHLQLLLEKWQAILRLQDWDLSIKYARAFEWDMGSDAGGHVAWFLEKRTAKIRILDPQDHKPPDTNFHPYDEEYTVVHELVHLHLVAWPHHGEGPEHVAEEQAVHALASALVALDRRTTAPSGDSDSALSRKDPPPQP